MIRLANKFDVEKVINLIKNFLQESNLSNHIKDNIDYTYINQLYHHMIIGGGLILVLEKDNELVGMIAGIKAPNIWHMEDYSLREIMFYIKPAYRKSRNAYNLLTKYNEMAQDMLDNNLISTYTMTKTENLDKINYGKFGYNKIEETWAVGM